MANPAILESGGQANIASNNISVQPGDVVGYFVMDQNGNEGGIQLETSEHENNTVWYSTLFQTEAERHQLQIGPSSNFSSTVAAPILSIDVCESLNINNADVVD